MWAFERIIDDAASMNGIATFAPCGGDESLAYHEEGSLCLANGQLFGAIRDYHFQYRQDGFAVFFAETPLRLFHEILLTRNALGELTGSASHQCNNDLYTSSYKFASTMRFSIEHVAFGPRKNYISRTQFRRP